MYAAPDEALAAAYAADNVFSLVIIFIFECCGKHIVLRGRTMAWDGVFGFCVLLAFACAHAEIEFVSMCIDLVHLQ